MGFILRWLCAFVLLAATFAVYALAQRYSQPVEAAR